MALRADAAAWNPPNPAEREILKRLAVISAQLARVRQTQFRRENYLGVGRGTPTYPTEGKSLALPTEQRFNLEAREMIPGGLLDGGRRRRRTKRSKRRQGTRRHRK